MLLDRGWPEEVGDSMRYSAKKKCRIKVGYSKLLAKILLLTFDHNFLSVVAEGWLDPLLISATHLPMTFSLSAHLAYKLYTHSDSESCVLCPRAHAQHVRHGRISRYTAGYTVDSGGVIVREEFSNGGYYQLPATRLWAICCFCFRYYTKAAVRRPLSNAKVLRPLKELPWIRISHCF